MKIILKSRIFHENNEYFMEISNISRIYEDFLIFYVFLLSISVFACWMHVGWVLAVRSQAAEQQQQQQQPRIFDQLIPNVRRDEIRRQSKSSLRYIYIYVIPPPNIYIIFIILCYILYSIYIIIFIHIILYCIILYSIIFYYIVLYISSHIILFPKQPQLTGVLAVYDRGLD